MLSTRHRQDPGPALMVVGVVAIFCSALIIIGQGIIWLSSGSWPELSFAAVWHFGGLSKPEVRWADAMIVISWLFDRPFSGILFCSGLATFLGASTMGDK